MDPTSPPLTPGPAAHDERQSVDRVGGDARASTSSRPIHLARPGVERPPRHGVGRDRRGRCVGDYGTAPILTRPGDARPDGTISIHRSVRWERIGTPWRTARRCPRPRRRRGDLAPRPPESSGSSMRATAADEPEEQDRRRRIRWSRYQLGDLGFQRRPCRDSARCPGSTHHLPLRDVAGRPRVVGHSRDRSAPHPLGGGVLAGQRANPVGASPAIAGGDRREGA
jgi:hypothetical protein